MNDVTVACSCGREMLIDPLRGRGSFKCGCGARVRVRIPRKPQCGGIPGDKGVRCVGTPVRESADVGIFLCRKHLQAYREHIDELEDIARSAEDRYTELYHLERAQRSQAERDRRETLIDEARAQGRLVVYYIRIGDLIKIGTTTNLKRRMDHLQPDELLATEPGHLDLERQRHLQFDHLRLKPRSERFRMEPELLDHIAMVRERYGEPKDRFSAA